MATATDTPKGYTFSRQQRIVVQRGDLLKQEGLKIVHCPTQFETDLNLIFKDSLIGQFVIMARLQQTDLDAQINKWCEQNRKKGKTIGCPQSRNTFFKIGELCPVTIGEQQYCLAAFNQSTSQQDLLPMTVSLYKSFWKNVWQNFQSLGPHSLEICVPIPGGNYVDDKNEYFSINQKIGVIAESFFSFAQTTRRRYTLHICVNPSDREVNCDHWNEVILPYLFDRFHLDRTSAAKDTEVSSSPIQHGSTTQKFDWTHIDTTVTRVFDRLIAAHGQPNFTQYHGNRKETITISLDVHKLKTLEKAIVDNTEFQDQWSEGQLSNLRTNRFILLLLNFLLDNNLVGELTATSCVRILQGRGIPDTTILLTGEEKSLLAERSKNNCKFDSSVTQYLLKQL